FFQAEDGIRDFHVTGVQTCALPIYVGLVRTVNEDACLARPDLGIWAIADGMGGHDCGDYASNLIIGELGRVRRPGSARELLQARSEERRVGKEGRWRWGTAEEKTKA